MEISLKRKISIIGIGSISTLSILLMVETLFAQILTDTILNNISDNLMLLIIMTGMLLIVIIISIIVGYFVSQDIHQDSVYKSFVISLLCLLLFLFTISNGSLLIYYREVYSGIRGFEILFVSPEALIKFSIYILGDVFLLFILEIVVYYIFFVIFLEKFYKRVK